VDARSFTVGIGDPEPEFERGAVFAFEGGQVVTRVRQTGVNGTRADNGTDADRVIEGRHHPPQRAALADPAVAALFGRDRLR
jgi:hypothetical protein